MKIIDDKLTKKSVVVMSIGFQKCPACRMLPITTIVTVGPAPMSDEYPFVTPAFSGCGPCAEDFADRLRESLPE